METKPQIEQRLKRTTWIVVACLFVGFVVFALVGLGHGEPSIRGHSLTAWIEKSMRATPGSPAQVEARQAILEIETDAIPHLLFCLEGKKTSKDKLAEYLTSKGYTKAATWLVGSQPFLFRQFFALHGFEVLGTNGVAALPQLVEMLDRPFDTSTNKPQIEVHSAAAHALAFQGRQGQLQLLSRFPGREKSYQEARATDCVLALSKQKLMESEVLEAIHSFAASSNGNDQRMALAAIRNLEGNVDLKRILLDWAFKSGWDFVFWDALGVLESTPDLIPEFHERVSRLGPLRYPETDKIRVRLLALPKSSPK